MQSRSSAIQARPDTPAVANPRWTLAAPSWLASVVIHGLLLLLFASNLKSCGPVVSGEPGGDFREVGVFVKPDANLHEQADEPEESNDPPADGQQANQAENTAAAEADPFQVPDRPPVDLQLPQTILPAIGAGNPVPVPRAPGDVAGLIRPNGSARPQALGLGKGETQFFGIRDQATRFAYLLDCSASMANKYNAFGLAKAELMASIQALEKTQQFHVVFYNQLPRPMKLRGEMDAEFYWATDVNRTLAGNFVRGVQADGGTDHMPALRAVLRMNPEVLYFLTDADDPQLSAGELNQLQRLNQGRTRIHCIEFGTGPNLAAVDHFLKKLARQNGGTHRYVDVTKSGRR